MILKPLSLAQIAHVVGVLFLGAMMFACDRHGAASPVKAETSEIDAIMPLKMEQRMELHKRVLEDRKARIGGLLLVVQNLKNAPKEDFEGCRLSFAIRMLGDLRAVEAVQPLINIVDLQFSKVMGLATTEDDSEVIQALVKIGKPASTKAVEYLAGDKSSKRAPRYVRVIAQVEGIELGKVMVRLAAVKEQNPEKKARLEAAIALFDKAGEPIP